jgi:hypothetical protein
LALSKLERNFERDRDDVQRLARAGHLRPEVLSERYYKRTASARGPWRPARLDAPIVAGLLLAGLTVVGGRSDAPTEVQDKEEAERAGP